MTRFVVVTGTDTNVGKTFVTRAFARMLVDSGRRVVAIKPFESGATGAETDAALLADATGQREPRQAIVSLRDPLAPAMAADREGITLDLAAVRARIVELAAGFDIAIVEGAGGVLSPLTWTTDITTLAHDLDAGVVLVASDRLGTLSATHCAVQVLLDGWLLPAAIVLSAPAEADLSTGLNADALRRRLAPYGPCSERIVELPRCALDSAAQVLAPIVDWL
ncbi:MAG TPA: dethiobiotin synthase [Kofleriaceae bacterium]|nr:dethiobiotin synthase [Kofleriaceae bacterium]